MSSLRVCVINFPFRPGVDSAVPLSELLRVLERIASSTHVITANLPEDMPRPEIHLCNIRWSNKEQPIVLSVPKNIVTQLKFSFHLIKKAREFDIVLFFGAGTFLLPMLATRLTRKRLLLVVTTSETKIAERIYNQQSWLANRIARGPVPVLEGLGRKLCHRIVVYSPNLIREMRLDKYSRKISIAHEHFLDFSEFRVTKPFNERENLVGYVARLSPEKGILNFMEAIPKVVEARQQMTFLIIGDGPLRPQVEEYANKSNNKVKYAGWIPHDKLPGYLNELRLLVVPSYTETGPYIAFEAMACGTPVVGTPDGLMADMLSDGENGFIMEDNSPECIARNIVRALNHPDLEQVAHNARKLAEREFTFEKAVDSYRGILENLSQRN